MIAGLRLAFSWLTVLPVHTRHVDRDAARWAIACAPVVGLVLGAAGAGLLVLLDRGLLGGVLVVAFLALATRGMHLDGLADTADGLGSYRGPEKALAIMRDGPVGPFGVVAIVLVLGAQAAAIHDWQALVIAVVTGRVAFTICCHQAVPAARPEGLGALVAGTQPTLVPVAWVVALAAASVVQGWRGPVAVVVATGLVVLLVRHTRKRFGGITGDVLGATSELATTVVLVALS
ncbi:adenosylcobinamide-GDP ribazoletransferase [Actinophytocola algeriensis]|uniref:Adenosylcobinamide-GDP ribazoletransferase n=1 Tax=Actinophytocola algeriensis TaxID=1768010 RepID=A0A7W7VC89_9PSEU|nr:adenosylcobinamide-GDP ribazoletransferase [Actinophytocola algeriensis]MBB4904767.1 adenosylcobinamide-GDP ribazoletransferase [Actinophytocola algeriensis]MBE1476374.1 adenosylcobinamide-GDP ribazoletransferase [Actinophytocola algeriensis]